MCRLLGYCAADRVSLAELLGKEGLAEFTALSAIHRDGWGMAWYDSTRADALPVIEKSVRAAATEPRFTDLAGEPLGGLGMVHLRWATPGLPVLDCNTHPFELGQYVLAHNGAIYPQERLPAMLAPEWEKRVGGTTDSERYFLHLMLALDERGGDVLAAVADTTADIADRYTPNSLNAILLAPGAMYVISWFEPERIPRDLLLARGLVDSPENIEAYFDLSYRADEAGVVVASSGWDMPPGWTPLPNRHVLAVDQATMSVTVHPIPVRARALSHAR
jgi:predicted glutamine amidotransferase